MAYDKYYEFYEKNGFFFDRGLLTSYCLSLFTKPFVILSGISGTGKTKIAQLFSHPAMQASKELKSKTTTPSVEIPGKWILMTLTDGVMASDADGRANFRYQDIDAMLSAEEIAALGPKIEELRKSNRDDNICEPWEIKIKGVESQEIKARVYLQRASSPLLRVRFKSKKGEPFYDSTAYFKKFHKKGDVLKLEKIGEKELKIVSINESKVIEKFQELNQKEEELINNTCFVSVRTDWTDSSSIFGYFNLIEQKYHITTLVNFILRARENPELPFFLILDEMNLAKVEHYFSDFLSCLESRRKIDGVLHQERIRLYSGSSPLDTDDAYFDVISPELDLPQNLFVTGTVNIDESTYMFSSKVLDRANVIELNEVDLVSYGSSDKIETESEFVLSSFPPFPAFSLASKQDYMDCSAEAKSILEPIHKILAKHHLHFGYRVINEIALYLANVEKFCEKTTGLLNTALDFQLVQKVFPKLSGPQSKLDIPIRELLHYLVKTTDPLEKFDYDAIQRLEPISTEFPRSVAKLKRMYVGLTLNGFTNFVE